MENAVKETKFAVPRYLKVVSIGISLLCVFLIILHAIFPEISIDTTTIALIVILIFPWLLPYIKTAKLPGGFEVTTRDVLQLEEITRRSAIGTVPVAMRAPEVMRERARPLLTLSQARRYMLLRTDPNLALASLRLDIENMLKELGAKKELRVERQPLWRVLNSLLQKKIIGSSEYESLRRIISICNSAVHAEKIDSALASRVLVIGDLALQYLDSKMD